MCGNNVTGITNRQSRRAPGLALGLARDQPVDTPIPTLPVDV